MSIGKHHLNLSYVEGKDSVRPTDNFADIGNYKKQLELINKYILELYNHPYFIIGAGISELLDLVVYSLRFGYRKDRITILSPAYGCYKQTAERYRCRIGQVVRIEQENGQYHQKPMCQIIDDVIKSKPNMLIFSNPGNPTPDWISLRELKELLSSVKGCSFVVIDEAFIEYATDDDRETALTLIKQYDNLIVLRTFSKAYGLFGLRIGILLANKNIIDILSQHQKMYTISQSSIEALLRINIKDMRQYRKKIFHRNKKRTHNFVKQIPSLEWLRDATIWFGQTNFALIALKNKEDLPVVMKDVSSKFDDNHNWYRIRIPDNHELSI